MAGYIHEFFGYRATDTSSEAVAAARALECPFLHDRCEKTLSNKDVSGVCAIKPVTTAPVICCPIRLYAEDYAILRDVSDRAFGAGIPLEPGRAAKSVAQATARPTVAVFGKKWGGELRLPQRAGRGSYFVDWVLALLDPTGNLTEFVAIEVQSIDTTGNYQTARRNLLSDGRSVTKDTVGLNWENVSKRILPQLIYKGQVLQRESHCHKGLFFVSPVPVYRRIMDRLGGADRLAAYPYQPASITFMAYDYAPGAPSPLGQVVPISLATEHSTTVFKVQESFSNVTLPSQDVYLEAITNALAG